MKGRSKSPGPSQKAEKGEGKAEEKANATDKKAEAKFEPPPRPAGLRGTLLKMYGMLAAGLIFFALVGENLKHPVSDGKFEKKDGTIIDIGDFDASELGPHPKCHPHFEEHLLVDQWVKNKDAPKEGPFPVGHPDNPEWLEKSDLQMKKKSAETRFQWEGLQPNLHLLFLATLCVIIGAKHGVWMFTEPAETRQASQVLQSEDAYWFPIMGSCTLFGLFVVLKYFGTDYIKLAITCFIVMMCAFGIGTNVDHITALVRNKCMKPLFRIPYFDQDVTVMEILGSLVGASMAVAFVFTKNWIVNNVFGVSFSILGIKTIGISSYKTGAIMLVGLFFYDVFWVFGSKSVFGSNVMVSVAMGVEAPIKLMFPRGMGGCGNLQHSMLGLGDIVVPGLFIAFMAKWDAVKIGQKASTSFVYLNAIMVAYVLSLITTVAIMLFFNAAQPALLYIVPYVLVASAGVALQRGEFKELWAYYIPDETAEVEKKIEDEKKKEEKKES
eukprot:CAMPEP_0115099190 /NCGR_PEP_ID=MMETSP0227-20121206/31684_1 /TAXON_ID=89957 /ORGANISM="Polarella glacialis, Strain CCMP 1383" /LENGTH=495 /DNA_ID=CAMNT_0002494093 /DNA_START=71 /DNA_END=1558 /DNA_ORIENTATION=-